MDRGVAGKIKELISADTFNRFKPFNRFAPFKPF